MKKQYIAITLLLTLNNAIGQTVNVPQVPLRDPINVSQKKIIKTVEFRKFTTTLNSTDNTGQITRGVFCSDKENLFYNPQYNQGIADILSNVFKANLEKAGYPKYEPGESLFEDKTGDEADFVVGAVLKDLKHDLCWKDGQHGYGKSYTKIRWQVYSNQFQKLSIAGRRKVLLISRPGMSRTVWA